MPFYQNLKTEDFHLALWRIEEQEEYFSGLFHAHPDMANEFKRIQWYASRHLVNEMLGNPNAVIKDGNGMPAIKNSQQSISLSHTPQFAAAMLSSSFKVGIDLETVNPKVQRIAHKFLTEEEIVKIPHDIKTEKLILYWSAKEALYKLYGRGGLEFRTQLLVEDFLLAKEGNLKASISTSTKQVKGINISYKFIDDHVLTYIWHEQF